VQLRRFAGMEDGEQRRFTALHRWTAETLSDQWGEIVMEDTPRELRRHLPILLAAERRVLVSGLGLGCVVRGLLAVRRVTHIDVIEIDASILAHVGKEFIGNPRIALHHGDALTVAWPGGSHWEFAWHDVWSEERHLAVVHAELLARYSQWCDRQGAWQLPRAVRDKWPRGLLGARRRTAA